MLLIQAEAAEPIGEGLIQLGLVLLYEAMVAFTVVVILLRKKDPSSALAWSLAVFFIPLLGMVSFYTFGVTKIPRRLKRKVLHRSAYERSGVDGLGDESAGGLAAEPWRSIGHLAEVVGEAPRRSGNRVELLGRGPLAFERMFAAIAEATDHVHLETFIFRDDGLGQRLLELLIERVEQGVVVRLIVDSLGTVAGRSILRRLRSAGGEGHAFMPIFGKRYTPNLRNHRKIVVCDGEVAFFGGLNIGEEYLGRIRRRGRGWCDLHFELRGPSVGDVQAIFAEDWHFCSEQLLTGERYFPISDRAPGSAPIQIISGGPDQDVNAIRQTFFATVTRARQKLWIASPYLIPDSALFTAMVNAALRGVEVIVLTQGQPPDSYPATFCGASYYEELLAAGVRIFEYGAGMMHAKMLLADEAWAVVGSANLDNRSLSLNFELAALLDGSAEVEALAKRFGEELAEAREIDLETFRRRPIWRQVVERGARLFAPLM